MGKGFPEHRFLTKIYLLVCFKAGDDVGKC